MDAVGERLRELVETHLPGPGVPVREHEPLTSAERERVVTEWNRTDAPYPAGLCIHDLVAAQARRTPDATAVAAADGTLTYAALDRRANRLAHALRARGVGAEVRVGVLADRSAELVVALLGVLKAGGAYVPLDPAYPRERLQYMLADCGAGVLLAGRTQEALVGEVAGPEAGAPTVVWLGEEGADADPDSADGEAGDADRAPESGVGPDHLAYVIYTSGSTGRPKGVMARHRGVCNLAESERHVLALGPGARVLQFAPSSFDASVWEIFPTLAAGAALHLTSSSGPVAGGVLARALREGGITHVTLPPSVLASLPTGDYPDLGTLVVAGEPCPRELVDRWASGRRFVNAYGPSEATVCATLAECAPGAAEPPPIGRPLQNVRVYVLDGAGEPVPPGVAGELYLGGVGLARGYLHRPALTAERFVPDPFARGDGERLYRTGDRARWRATGELEFLGRVDEQVKVRGFRIEPGEVEAALRDHPSVHDCAVVARGDGDDRRLVAYVVPRGAAPRPRTLRAHLRGRMPEHMVPGEFVVLDGLPLSPSGKVDRAALPEPDGRAREQAAYEAPRTETEARVADVWRQVLALEQVGIHDDFIELGGNSLRALEVTARLQRAGAAEVPVRTLLDGCTVATLAAVLERPAEERGPRHRGAEIRRVPRDGPLPASVAQESIWLLTQLTPELPAYNSRSTILLAGPLHVPALEHALTEIVRRHEIYRTTFHVVEGSPHQSIHDPWPVHLSVTDLRGLEPAARRARADAIRMEEYTRPFDLTRLPLIRLRLIQLGDEEHELLFVEHHFVHDGWSFGIFMREMKMVYEAFLAGTEAELQPLHLQFADFAVWQREWLRTPQAAAQLAHWTTRLADTPPTLQLPASRPRPPVFSYRGGQVWTALPPAQVVRVRALAVQERTTLYVTTLAAFQALLFRYAAQARFNVGVSAANRRRPEFDSVTGFLVNIFPVRADLSGDPSFRELLRRTHAEMVSAQDNQEIPFGEIVRAVQPERALGHNPLFQVSFNFHNAAMPEPRMGAVSVTPLEAGDNGTAKFDLGVVAFPRADQRHGAGDEVQVVWEYSADLFDAAAVERMAEHYRVLMDAVCADPDLPLSRLQLLTPGERERLVEGWNRTDAPEPAPLTVHGLFEASAARTPDAPAVVFGAESISYAELNRRANRLAHALRRRGVGPEVRVGLSVQRSPEMLVGLLAILKAGGAYVPLDPGYPPERLGFMLRDSGAAILLAQAELARALSGHGAEVVLLDGPAASAEPASGESTSAASAASAGSASAESASGDSASAASASAESASGDSASAASASAASAGSVSAGSASAESANAASASAASASAGSASAGSTSTDGASAVDDLHGNPVSGVLPENLAYVIYTSGSTGTPKGVAVPHRGVCNLVRAETSLFGVDAESRVLQFAPLSFDASVAELGLAWCSGAALVLAPRDALLPGPALLGVLREARVSHLLAPPSSLAVMEPEPLPHLRAVVAGGERLPPEVAARWRPYARVFNAYGPTETTVCATAAACDADGGEAVSVGRPLRNIRTYVLDGRGNPVPVGVPGELHVGGIGVTRGYLGRPGLTAERFVPDPFAARPGGRLYRTGDRARWREAGELEVLGRVDEQVKVRGFRIEPGEVESVLAEHPGVLECAVAARGDDVGETRLVGYVVPRGAAPAPAELRAHLGTRLPDHMVPGVFVSLKGLPRTPSGKVDRAALPRPEVRSENAYEAPRTEWEAVLCGIFQEVLAVERVGIHDSFFGLGGHSLLATRAVTRIRDALHADVGLTSIFQHPTVAGLAESLRPSAGGGADGGRAEGADAPALSAAHLLSRMDELSDEEVERLLAQGAGESE